MVGPAGFIAAWAGAGAATRGYSPVDEHISRLAASGAPTRAAMTLGFVCFGVSMPLYSRVLRDAVPGPAWATLATGGLATLVVAAFPLDVSPTIDAVHAAAATTSYAALALTPVLAARRLELLGYRRSARASTALGTASAACLAATALGPAHGLLQRAGLTIVDVWIVASAIAIAIVGDRRDQPVVRTR